MAHASHGERGGQDRHRGFLSTIDGGIERSRSNFGAGEGLEARTVCVARGARLHEWDYVSNSSLCENGSRD